MAAILAEGAHRFQPGLLGAADGGVLYVDEVNLLADHLVDVLLDAAASGVNRVERDGVSHVHPSRFVLVGSMNPEEGELRPQLLDRFGLSVRVSTPSDPDARVEAVRRRIAFDADPAGFVSEWSAAEEDLASRLRVARPVPLEAGLERAVAELCVAAGAEGLRADLVICRAAAALAGWRAKPAAGEEEIVAVAPFALAHRRRTPFGASAPDPAELDDLVSDALGAARPSPGGTTGGPEAKHEAGGRDSGPERAGADGGSPEPTAPSAPPPPNGAEPPQTTADPSVIKSLFDARRAGGSDRAGRGRSKEPAGEGRGRLVGTEPVSLGARGPFAPGATVVATVVRTSGARPLRIEAGDLRLSRSERRGDNVIVLAVDTSGSMGVTERVAAARDAVLSLVADAYQRRDRVALVTYRDRSAQVVLRPTSSTEVALARLGDIATGGRTPLSAGIDAARALALGDRRAGSHPVVVVVTDGRATWARDGREPRKGGGVRRHRAAQWREEGHRRTGAVHRSSPGPPSASTRPATTSRTESAVSAICRFNVPSASRNTRPAPDDGWTPRPTSSLTTMVGRAADLRATSPSRSPIASPPPAPRSANPASHVPTESSSTPPVIEESTEPRSAARLTSTVAQSAGRRARCRSTRSAQSKSPSGADPVAT